MYTLSMDERNELREALSHTEDLIEEVKTEYSGRGMDGSLCFAIKTESPFQVFGSLCTHLGEAGHYRLATKLFSEVSVDDLGFSKIIYFPNVGWGADVDFEDEEHEEDY